MLFEQLLVIRDREPARAAMNMAIDEALLDRATLPVLRFYAWQKPSLSFGYFGRFTDAAREAGDRELVRRWTGGGSVRHGDDLTYSLITPASSPAGSASPGAIYATIHRAIRDALADQGIVAHLVEASAPKISEACFANPVTNDLIVNGHKIAGAAQRRTRRGFLHQGSIQLPNLSKSFQARFAAALAAKILDLDLSTSVLARAKTLAARKYDTDEWQRRW
jgi:lipoate-protein ligase A